LSIVERRQDVAAPCFLDYLDLQIQAAEVARARAVACLAACEDGVESLVQVYAENGCSEAAAEPYVRRLDELRSRLTASQTSRLLTVKQAAERLRLTKPDGSPRDSAYKTVKSAGGKMIAGKLMIAEDALEAFVQNGRSR
jgi:Tfp pilus assembly protein PilX